MIHFHIISLFPDVFPGYVDASMLGKAQEAGLLKISYYNPRGFSVDKHHRVDDVPYGGGPGMVMQAEPLLFAWEEAVKNSSSSPVTIVFSPGGEQFSQSLAKDYAGEYSDVILVCGRYEGIDQRFIDITEAQLLSIGPYVLTGGELPAMTVIDAVARHIPGVLGKAESIEEDRISSHVSYTRPEALTYKGREYKVPEVLLSGHHAKIDAWRKEQGGFSGALDQDSV